MNQIQDTRTSYDAPAYADSNKVSCAVREMILAMTEEECRGIALPIVAEVWFTSSASSG